MSVYGSTKEMRIINGIILFLAVSITAAGFDRQFTGIPRELRKGKRWPDPIVNSQHYQPDRSSSSRKVPWQSKSYHVATQRNQYHDNHEQLTGENIRLLQMGDHFHRSKKRDDNVSNLHRTNRNNRRHILNNDGPYDTSEADRREMEDILRGRPAEGSPPGRDANRASLGGIHQELNKENSAVPPLLFPPRPCRRPGSVSDTTDELFESTPNNCTERYHFPSAVFMIEAHYNQTVRDFLQICTAIERVEVDGLDDVQALLNAIYQQMLLTRSGYNQLQADDPGATGTSSQKNTGVPPSVVLLFNLENFSNWTSEKVIGVLRTIISTLHSDYNEIMIYSKFHLDGADSNETRLLQLRYDVKYWLADVCNPRSTPCADFSSIILQSVLHMNELAERPDNLESSEDFSSGQANEWCRQLGMGPGSRIIDIRVVPTDPSAGHYHREESSLMLADILPRDQKTYDKNRAPKFFGQPTIVYFHVTVLSIDTINEESMTYVADIFLAQSWRDHRLRLPENMTEEYRILDVGWLQDIWRPDCFFKNAKKVTFHEMSVPNHYLWLYHDKTLIYMAKLTLVLSCAMKFESYPHDTQICSMQIESLSHTTHDLVFKWNLTDPLVTNPDIELPQLDIAKNSTEDCTLEYSTGNFTCLAVVFNLRRRLGYHLFHTYIPSGLIVVMSWISFWIKPEAIPARITLGVTSLLTLATQSTQSQRSLPPVSYVKAIDVWMSSCTLFVFMSLMEFAVVNTFMGPIATKPMKGYSDEDLSARASLFNGKSASARLRSGAGGKVSESPVRMGPPPPPPGPQYVTFCHGREVALFIDFWSRLFFPFSFIILNIVYWTTFLH